MHPFYQICEFFFTKLGILRIGETYSKMLHPETSTTAKNSTKSPTLSDLKRIKEPRNGILQELIEKRITVNLGTLKEEISNLTQLLNQLIRESSARHSPTVDTRTQQTQARRSSSIEVGTSEPCQLRKSEVRDLRPTLGVTLCRTILLQVNFELQFFL